MTVIEIRCPVCYSSLNIHAQLNTDFSYTNENMVKNAIIRYMISGKQDYKNHVERLQIQELKEDQQYQWKFHIQTYDSPEGDEWISGVAELPPHGHLKILEIEMTDY